MKNLILLFLGLLLATIVQAQVATKLVNLTTAGTLSTVLTPEELSSTVAITLTGTIDARDFKTMRDSMPSLAEIDLSGVSIVVYVGTKGTSRNDTIYPSNTIPNNALQNNNDNPFLADGLISVKLPLSVSSIGDFAFSSCNSLTSIDISSTVINIGKYAFAWSRCLINVDNNNPNYSSIDGILFNKAQTELIQCPVSKYGSYSIPSTVTSIGESAFSMCPLTSINIPSTVDSIGQEAFWGCGAIKSITIPSSVKYIGALAFYETQLSSISIPSSVNYIGESAFVYCPLTSITVEWMNPLDISSSYDVFKFLDKSTCTLYVPSGSQAAYLAANQWQDFLHIIDGTGLWLSNTSKNIPSNAGYSHLTTINGNSSWTVTSNQPWVTVNPTQGNGNGVLNISYDENATGDQRVAKVTIADANNIVHEVNINQAFEIGVDDLVVKRTSKTPVINGEIDVNDPWGDEWLSMNKQNLINPTNDMLSRFQIFAGEDAFYIAIVVDDATPSNDLSIENSYERDCSDLLFSMDTSAYDNGGAYREGTWNIRTQREHPDGLFIDGNSHANIWDVSSLISHSGFSAFSKSTPTGYVQEFILPFEALKGNYDWDGEYFRFEVYTSDNSTGLPGGRTQMNFWNDNSDNQWHDTRTFGVVRLEPSNSPVAKAGNDQHVEKGVVVTLDGTASYDPNDLALSYLWTAPVGVQLSSATDAKPTFTISDNIIAAQLVFKLVVNNGERNSIADEVVVFVRQEQEATIEATPGNLSALLGVKKEYLTVLTMTGTIDARDFITMRDSMPMLAEIDLSGVSIVAYNGTEGTINGTGNYNYPANEVPQQAFINSSGEGKTTLVSVVFPSTITSIGHSAFQNCSKLTSVNIPNGVTYLGSIVFSGCNNLESIFLPNTLTEIGQYAFSYCTKLKDINIPASVTLIRDIAFSNCAGPFIVDASNPNYSSLNGVLFDKNKITLLQYPISPVGEYNIPSSVKTIGNSAFENCDNLTTVTIPEGVTTIGSSAFNSCSNLTSVSIPLTVSMIDNYAFVYTDSMVSITANCSIPVDLSNVNNVFDGINKNTCTLYVPYGSKSTYQNAVQWKDFQNIIEIEGLFPSTASLSFNPSAETTKIFIASSVGWSAESSANWLSIDPASSQGSDSLSISVTQNAGDVRTATITIHPTGLPDQTITVTQYGVVQVTAGSLAAVLGNQLETTTSLTLVGTIDARDFKTMRDDMPLLAEIDLSGASIVAYEGTEGTNPWGNNEYYQANSIPSFAFHNNQWQGKNTLTTFVFPANLSKIGHRAFHNCQNLIGLNLPGSLQSIDSYVFQDCPKITEVFIPSSVKNLYGDSFDQRISYLVDPANAHYSSVQGGLYNKAQTVLVRVPTTKTGSFAVVSTVTEIGQDAFNGCTQLTNIELPANLQRIAWGAFRYCYQINTLNLPASVNFIDGYAFEGCTGINSINVNAQVPVDLTERQNVFWNVNKTSCLMKVPFGTKAAYQAAAQWQDFQNIVEMPGLFPSATSLGFGPSAATKKIFVAASAAFTATSDQNWLSVVPASNNGSDSLAFTVSAYAQTGNRTATVTLHADGFDDQTITVTQNGIVEVTAGNLKAILGNQLSTITNLTLTGTIDARDFKTMRDNMPALAELDMSGVSIASYTGAEGTASVSSIYPANAIPANAFNNPITYLSKTSLTSVVLPSSITSIDVFAFANCSNLASCVIPSSVTSIGNAAFSTCNKLPIINISSAVTHIGIAVFYSYNGIVVVDPTNPKYSSIDGVLFDKNQTTLMYCTTSKTGNYTIPSTVVSIDIQAFVNCSKLTSVVIPPSVQTIKESAFESCIELTSITIPSSVTSIGSFAFNACRNLNGITVRNPDPVDLSQKNNVFANVDKNLCTLYVPAGTKAAYQLANQWQDFLHIIDGTGLWLSNTSKNIPSNAGNAQLSTINGNTSWTVTSNQPWLTVSPTQGNGNGVLNISYDENTTGAQRLAKVTITDANNMTYEAAINQILEIEVDNLVVKRTTKAPVADGLIDANDPWGNEWIAINKVHPSSTTTDMQSRFQILAGKDAFYIAIAIDDATPNNDLSIENSYERDCSNLYFSMDTSAFDNGGAYKEGTWMLRTQREHPDGLFIDGNSHANTWDIGSLISHSGFSAFSKSTPTSYVQEFILPFEALEGDFQWDQEYFRFEVYTSDNTTGDNGGRTQMKFWNDNSDNQWMDTRALGVARLEPMNMVDVTFRVNMQGQTISPNGVHLNGSFFNWQNAIAMTLDGDGYYSATVSLMAGETYTYKFINGGTTEWGNYEIPPSKCTVGPHNDRQITIASTNMVLEPVCFGSCYNCEKPDEAHADIQRTPIAPVIDGTPDHIWSKVAPIPISKAFVGENPTVQATWKAIYDSTNIYLLVEVIDDDHYPAWEAQSQNFWEYDHPEIFLDVNNYLPDGKGPNVGSGHHVIGNPITEGGYGMVQNIYWNDTISWCYRLNGENLMVEYAIPFASLIQGDGTPLNMNMVREMRALGFDITLDDRDANKDRRDRMVWQNTGLYNEAYMNMDDCGTISLIDQKIVLDSVQVTFSVDMKNELIDNAGVFVGGSWNSWMSWVNPVPMLPIGSVYSATIKVPEGSTFDYKFKNGSTWESISGSCTSSVTDDRQLQLVGSNVVLDAVCFNNCSACEEQTDSVEVTFRVNMQNETISANGVYLNGSWSNWQVATPMFLSNNVYTATVKLLKGESFTYKFINGAINEYDKYEILTEQCAVGAAGDRSLLVPQNNTTLDVVCFGKCFDCEYYLDRVAPVIVSMQPANQSVVDVSLNKLTITFSENIVFGTGCMQLREASGQIVSQVCAANWVITGNKLEVRIGNLAPNTSYYVTIASNAIADMAGNYFAGISDPTQYTFTTGSGQLTPHFTTVWTGNGTDHMNINITTVKLDGLDLEAGDEVALFDGNLCVGAGLVTATVSNTNVLVIKASSNEGSGNGYTAGHAITYKLYDRSADKEYTSVTATYSSSLPTWSIDGKYAVGATAFAQLNATATATQTIALRKGWNIVSATVMPGNPNLMGIFQPLVNTATLRKVMNEAGGTIEDWGEYGGWKNEIGNLLPTEGYKVNVSADCSLSVEGTVVPLPMDIPLNAGWNIIGYPAQVAQNGKDAMQSLIDSGKLRKVMDEAGRTIEDWGSFGGWINNIGSFAPGKGYKVNVTSACTLRIAETSLKSMMVEPTIQHSDKFQTCFAGNGYNHMNINIVNLQQSGLCVNDEIAIFDGDLCVGSATLSEGNMAQNRIAIAASANDGVSKKANGFTEGHPVQLKADHRGKVMETNLTDGKTFVQNGSLLIDLALFNQSLSSPSITKDADVFECYPNPLTSQLFIDVRNIRASDIDIAIYDVTGRKIKQVYSGANDGTTLYFWERGAALAGAYFCKVNGIVKKIIIID